MAEKEIKRPSQEDDAAARAAERAALEIEETRKLGRVVATKLPPAIIGSVANAVSAAENEAKRTVGMAHQIEKKLLVSKQVSSDFTGQRIAELRNVANEFLSFKNPTVEKYALAASKLIDNKNYADAELALFLADTYSRMRDLKPEKRNDGWAKPFSNFAEHSADYFMKGSVSGEQRNCAYMLLSTASSSIKNASRLEKFSFLATFENPQVKSYLEPIRDLYAHGKTSEGDRAMQYLLTYNGIYNKKSAKVNDGRDEVAKAVSLAAKGDDRAQEFYAEGIKKFALGSMCETALSRLQEMRQYLKNIDPKGEEKFLSSALDAAEKALKERKPQIAQRNISFFLNTAKPVAEERQPEQFEAARNFVIGARKALEEMRNDLRRMKTYGADELDRRLMGFDSYAGNALREIENAIKTGNTETLGKALEEFSHRWEETKNLFATVKFAMLEMAKAQQLNRHLERSDNADHSLEKAQAAKYLNEAAENFRQSVWTLLYYDGKDREYKARQEFEKGVNTKAYALSTLYLTEKSVGEKVKLALGGENEIRKQFDFYSSAIMRAFDSVSKGKGFNENVWKLSEATFRLESALVTSEEKLFAKGESKFQQWIINDSKEVIEHYAGMLATGRRKHSEAGLQSYGQAIENNTRELNRRLETAKRIDMGTELLVSMVHPAVNLAMVMKNINKQYLAGGGELSGEEVGMNAAMILAGTIAFRHAGSVKGIFAALEGSKTLSAVELGLGTGLVGVGLKDTVAAFRDYFQAPSDEKQSRLEDALMHAIMLAIPFLYSAVRPHAISKVQKVFESRMESRLMERMRNLENTNPNMTIQEARNIFDAVWGSVRVEYGAVGTDLRKNFLSQTAAVAREKVIRGEPISELEHAAVMLSTPEPKPIVSGRPELEIATPAEQAAPILLTKKKPKPAAIVRDTEATPASLFIPLTKKKKPVPLPQDFGGIPVVNPIQLTKKKSVSLKEGVLPQNTSAKSEEFLMWPPREEGRLRGEQEQARARTVRETYVELQRIRDNTPNDSIAAMDVKTIADCEQAVRAGRLELAAGSIAKAYNEAYETTHLLVGAREAALRRFGFFEGIERKDSIEFVSKHEDLFGLIFQGRLEQRINGLQGLENARISGISHKGGALGAYEVALSMPSGSKRIIYVKMHDVEPVTLGNALVRNQGLITPEVAHADAMGKTHSFTTIYEAKNGRKAYVEQKFGFVYDVKDFFHTEVSNVGLAGGGVMETGRVTGVASLMECLKNPAEALSGARSARAARIFWKMMANNEDREELFAALYSSYERSRRAGNSDRSMKNMFIAIVEGKVNGRSVEKLTFQPFDNDGIGIHLGAGKSGDSLYNMDFATFIFGRHDRYFQGGFSGRDFISYVAEASARAFSPDAGKNKNHIILKENGILAARLGIRELLDSAQSEKAKTRGTVPPDSDEVVLKRRRILADYKGVLGFGQPFSEFGAGSKPLAVNAAGQNGRLMIEEDGRLRVDDLDKLEITGALDKLGRGRQVANFAPEIIEARYQEYLDWQKAWDKENVAKEPQGQKHGGGITPNQQRRLSGTPEAEAAFEAYWGKARKEKGAVGPDLKASERHQFDERVNLLEVTEIPVETIMALMQKTPLASMPDDAFFAAVARAERNVLIIDSITGGNPEAMTARKINYRENPEILLLESGEIARRGGNQFQKSPGNVPVAMNNMQLVEKHVAFASEKAENYVKDNRNDKIVGQLRLKLEKVANELSTLQKGNNIVLKIPGVNYKFGTTYAIDLGKKERAIFYVNKDSDGLAKANVFFVSSNHDDYLNLLTKTKRQGSEKLFPISGFQGANVVGLFYE